MKKLLLILVVPLAVAACASTSNPPGPEGTGDHKNGYYLGRSDAAKQQYWMIQNLQKQPTKEPAAGTSYLPLTVGGDTNSAVVTVPHIELLRIDQP